MTLFILHVLASVGTITIAYYGYKVVSLVLWLLMGNKGDLS